MKCVNSKQSNIWDGITYSSISGEGLWTLVEIQVRFQRDQARGVSIWIEAFSSFDNVFVLFLWDVN